MIKAMIFDLDGTLVQTERLKALSYARAAIEQCLVIEDSPSGVKAALAAGMHLIAVSTPFTRDRLHQVASLPAEHVVDDPATLPDVVQQMFKEQGQD